MQLVLGFVLLFSQAPAQQSSTSLEGIVVKMGTSEAIARARVVMSNVDGGSGSTYAFTTDGAGRFGFRNIPPGRYRIFASRDGYVRAEYGQRNFSRTGATVTLVAGQEMKDVTLSMTATGAIAGRVYDRYGEPVVNANVQAFKYSYVDGRRILTVVQNARTNDLGEYRFYWMQPGQYAVSAVPPDGVRLEGNTVVIDAGPGSPVQVNGGTPGGSIRVAANVAAASGVLPASDTTYLPVYFPGTTDWAAAAPIDLRAGVNFTGVDLTVAETPALHVRGRAINGLTGQLAQGVSLQLIPRRGIPGGGPAQRNTTSSADGTFNFQSVVPGAYDLVGMINQGLVRNVPDGTARIVNGGNLTARIPIEIGSADVDNVQLVLQSGIKVSGRLTVEGLSTGQNPPTRISIELRPDPPLILRGSEAAAVAADGSFTANAPVAGLYRIQANGLPRNAYIKEARLGGSEVLNSGLRIDGAPQGELDIVIGLNPGMFDAVVLDDRQELQTNVTVVLVPDPARRQRSDAYENAFTGDSGRAHIEGVVPGDYKAFAWEDVEGGAWQDPDFIRKFEDRGKPVRILEGGVVSTELRVIKAQ